MEWRLEDKSTSIQEKPGRPGTHETRLVVYSAKSLRARERFLANLLTLLAVVVPGTLAISALGGLLIVDRALSPVIAVTEAARGVGPDSLSNRVPEGEACDEFSRLASVINGMLARIEASFQRERQFTGDASHELRSPITALRGELEVALRRGRSAEEYREVLERGLDQATRLQKIVEGLLLLTRADAGAPAEESTVDLGEVVRKTVDNANRAGAAAEIGLSSVYEGPALVRGSPGLLETLFANLLENAVRHGDPPIDVTIAGVEDAWEVRVTDAGPGIPPEHMPRIFDRFYRADPARSRATGGTGLGLALCRCIAEAHQGSIRAARRPPAGMEFVVVLPKLRDPAV
jgi:heavy metal sensor kinase